MNISSLTAENAKYSKPPKKNILATPMVIDLVWVNNGIIFADWYHVGWLILCFFSISRIGRLCEDEEYHHSNENCWTGTYFGDYTHDSAPTMSQKYNPEVPYSSSNEQFPRDSRLQVLIDKLINLKNVATKAVWSLRIDKCRSECEMSIFF